MNKKILAICASPRQHGNSETLLDKAIQELPKNAGIKKLILMDLNITPCSGCEACFKTGECVIKDDMGMLYKELVSCDILIIASPIYFQGLPCQLKCVIDRCQALWSRRYILKKPLTQDKSKRTGMVVLVAASRGSKNTFTGAIITLRAWFKTLGISYKKEFLAEGLEGPNAAAHHKEIKWKKA